MIMGAQDSSLCKVCGVVLSDELPVLLCPACLLGKVTELATPSTVTRIRDFAPPATEDLELIFPDFRFRGLLGRGGMGAVYHADQLELEREVALKILPVETAGDPEFRERFRREAATLAQLDHPNIVNLHDFGECEGFPYFVMEYVEGGDLSAQMVTGQFSTSEVLSIVSQVCDALNYSHDRGVVHRDIKPANILITPEGVVKIVDFGLVKMVGGDAIDPGLTRTLSSMGTPQYMAPEQLAGSTGIDHRADIYAVGVLLYEILTGKVPVGHFSAPSEDNTALNSRVDQVIFKALKREPEERFQKAEDLKNRLSEALQPRRNRPLQMLIFLTVLAGLIFILWPRNEDSVAPISPPLPPVSYTYDSSAPDANPRSQGWLLYDIKTGDGGNAGPSLVEGKPAWRLDDHLIDEKFNHPSYSLKFKNPKEDFARFYEEGWEFSFTCRIEKQGALSDYTAFCGWTIPGKFAPPGWEIPKDKAARVGFFIGHRYKNRFFSKGPETFFFSRDMAKMPLEKLGRRSEAYERPIVDSGAFHTVKVIGFPRSFRYDWYVDGDFAGSGRITDELFNNGKSAFIAFQSGSPKAIGRVSDWIHISLKTAP